MKTQELNEITTEVLVCMNRFYNHIKDDRLRIRYSITDVEVETQVEPLDNSSGDKINLVINIRSTSPGIIIGVRGKDIYALTDWLNGHFKTYNNIKVNLFEDRISSYWRSYEQEDFYDEFEYSFEDVKDYDSSDIISDTIEYEYDPLPLCEECDTK